MTTETAMEQADALRAQADELHTKQKGTTDLDEKIELLEKELEIFKRIDTINE